MPHSAGGRYQREGIPTDIDLERAGRHPIALDTLSVNSVQQEVQQQGRATARMYDRRHRWLPAELVPTWHASVVCIQMAEPKPAQSRVTK